MNGLEATQLIRQQKTSKELPIIALTAHAIADEKDKILQVGMNDYQTKPINNDQLMQCIERWTGFNCTFVKTKLDVQQRLPNSTYLAKEEKTTGDHDDCLVFDAEYAMRLANNKLDLATDMFSMLLNSLTEDLIEVESLWQKQQQAPLLQLIHKIHGATRYCGTPCLMHTMEQLETALKNSNLVDCDELYQHAIQSIIRLQQWAQENPWKEKLRALKHDLA
jgi:two-component system sensor histidine kinase BarA